jgi:dipeptidyl aminopeptidase/acylaminoacyl peptidase
MKRAFLVFLAAAASAAAAPPPSEYFFRGSRFGPMAVSPDGKSIAALAPVNGRQNLVILDAKTKAVKPVTGEKSRDIVYVRWVNNRRLIVRTGSLNTQAWDYRGGGLFAVDVDGGEVRLLSESRDERSTAGWRLVGRPVYPVRTLPGEGDDIIVQEWIYGDQRTRAGDLFRLDTRTARRTAILEGKPDSGEQESWIVDDRGVARVQVARDRGRVRIHYRASAAAPWQKLDELSTTAPGWRPLAIADDDKTLLVADQRQRDKAAIVTYDPATRSFGQPLAEHPQVDLNWLVFDYGRAVGVRYDGDRPGVAWFDEELAKLQSSIDSAMPGSVNWLSWSRDRKIVLVDSSSDRTPGSLYLLDCNTGKMEWLVDRRPWIKPAEMAPMRPVRYAARDGLSIPAYLTLPREGTGKHLPLVVIIHGGPWVYGETWGFDSEAQFLASRGYAVLQPNFRGTTRYGWKHFVASFNQWGLAMQDDIEDGVRWAIAEGIADPKRVCLYGGSYGGYSTMMGLAKTPDLYRCGINYVGVTDLALLMTATWSDNAYSESVQYSLREMVGDPDRDAERLRTTSPIHLADRIKAPVMLAYGAVDFRVPLEHGTRMRSALERNGANPVWLVNEGEGHGFSDFANRKAFYEAMEKFLAEHIGGDRPRF